MIRGPSRGCPAFPIWYAGLKISCAAHAVPRLLSLQTTEVALRTTWTIAGILLLACACSKAPVQQTGSASAAPAAAQTTPPAATGSAAPALPGQAAAPAPAVKPVPAMLPDVVARVNGEPLSKAEFENAIRALESQAGQGVPYDKRNDVYRQVLDQLVGFGCWSRRRRPARSSCRRPRSTRRSARCESNSRARRPSPRQWPLRASRSPS